MDALLQPILGAFAWLVMLSVGLDLQWRRLGEVAQQPTRYLLALLLNYGAVPLLALGITRALGVPEAAAAAVIVCAAAPGGPMGAFLAQQARGDLAMAVSVVLTVNLLNPLVTPAWIDAAGIQVGGAGIDLFGIFKTLLLFQLLPLLVGLLVREQAPVFAGRWQPRCARLASGLLVLLIVGFGIAKGEVLFQLDWRALLAVLSCVVGSLVGGLLLGRGAPGMPAALSMTAGIRNGSMALVLIGAWFPDPLTLLTALGYSVTMFPLSVAVSVVLRRRADAGEAAPAAA